MGSAGEVAAMEAATHQESAGQGSLLNKVYAMQCAQQQQQQQSTILTVVGGRMVPRSAPMPLNGQQLMMQLDGLTSAMTGMSVQEEAMESAEEDDSPYSQTCRRRDPVYLASMAAHALPTPQEMERHHLEQLQQQQEQQQRLEQQQLEYQLQLMQLQQQHQQLPSHQQQSCPAMSDHQVPDMETSSLNMSLPIDSDFHYGSGRVLKRPDLLPMGNFF